MMRRLVAGTDFSERAEWAELRSAMLAKECGGDLELLHVVNPLSVEAMLRLAEISPQAADAEVMRVQGELLDLAAGGLERRFGLAVARRLLVGRVAKTLAGRAAEGADLMVVGAHGGHFVENLFLGSTADKLARKISCPLLVVKRDPLAAYRRAVVAVDFSPASRLAMECAREVAPAAEILALHVFESPFEGKIRFALAREDALLHYVDAAETDAARRLEGFLAQWGNSRPVAGQVEHGHVATVLLRKLKEWDADLLVVGKHGQSELERLLLGSTTEHMIYEAGCDVLIAAG